MAELRLSLFHLRRNSGLTLRQREHGNNAGIPDLP
jgi:hypothetical protein